MLTEDQIAKLVNAELPEEEIRESLLDLTPDKIKLDTIKIFVETIQTTCIPELASSKNNNTYIDCSGTGGSGISRYNTSTAVAFVLAAGDLKVVKFGNRAVTSTSGSFDLLEALGFTETIPVEKIKTLLSETGLVFLYAPQAYPGLAKLAPIRKSLGVKTIFNYLGPLLNPFKPSYRLMGISNGTMQRLIAEYLYKYVHPKKALIVMSAEHLDELDPHSATTVFEVTQKEIDELAIGATCYRPPQFAATESQAVAESAKLLHKIFDGTDTDSDFYELICLNAGAGFYAAGNTASIAEGRQQAKEVLKSGKAMKKLEQLRSSYAKFN